MVIVPTHNRLRSKNNLIYFLDRFKSGKGYMDRKKKCHICFVDGVYYLTDGHHETVAAYLTDCLDFSQYSTEIFTLSQMLEYNHPIWMTPFNPHLECRVPDYWEYKEKLLSVGGNVADMLKMSSLYKEPRVVNSLAQLAMKEIDADILKIIKN
jgi:hypothetical protein